MPADRKLKPRKTPRQQRARQTLAAILEAAAQVFEREGYTRTTTDRIAARAGVSIGSLYQYFPNKDAIVVALAKQHVDAGLARVNALLAGASGGDALESVDIDVLLRVLVHELIATHRDHPRLHRLLFVEAPISEEQHARLEALENELIVRIASLLRAHPQVSVRAPELAAWMLVHVTQDLVHDFVVHPPLVEHTEEMFVDHLTGLLSAYVRSESGEGRDDSTTNREKGRSSPQNPRRLS